MPKLTSSQPKEQLTVRFAERWMGHLRRRAEEQQKSLSDVVEEMVEDECGWYRLPQDAAELLRGDSKKSGKHTQREYVVSLLMRRYQELVVEAHKSEGKR